MTSLSLAQLEPVIRAAWSEDTCDPVDLPWSSDNPSRGQCGVTALVLNDLLGGELLCAEVLNADGSRQGYHWWNRFADGSEVDLTREQFALTEIVQTPEVIVRPPEGVRYCAEQYALLSARVRATLKGIGSSPTTLTAS